MATRDSILDRIDTELAEFEENTPFVKRDEAYFSDLQIKTGFRNALYNIPFSDRIAGLMDEKADILHSLMEYWAGLNFKSLGIERDDFYEIINTYIEEIDFEDRYAKLYERASEEYFSFVNGLKQKTPEDVVEAAYEIVLKADILCLLDPQNMTKKEINILLTLEKPLDAIYSEWMDNDYSHMDLIEQTMDGLIKEREKSLALHQYNFDEKIPEIMQDYYDEYEGSKEPENEEAGSELEPG